MDIHILHSNFQEAEIIEKNRKLKKVQKNKKNSIKERDNIHLQIELNYYLFLFFIL
jgi:hypothetical protein